MTTAQLHPALRGDIQKLATADAIVLLIAAVLCLILPDILIRWVGLGTATALGVRAAGVGFLVVGAPALLAVRGELPRAVVVAFAAGRLALALALVVAPLALRLAVSARGWFAIAALFLYLVTSGGAWLFVGDRLSEPAQRAASSSR